MSAGCVCCVAAEMSNPLYLQITAQHAQKSSGVYGVAPVDRAPLEGQIVHLFRVGRLFRRKGIQRR